jgi:DNA-binding response OmpR family regulator
LRGCAATDTAEADFLMDAGDGAGSAGDDRAKARTHGEIIRIGQLRLDLGRMSADTGHGPVPLTRLEFLLLKELANHAGQPVPKSKLLATVWGYEFDPGSNIVNVCVQRLRLKLGFDLIKTVRGEGYQVTGQLRRGADPTRHRPAES